MPPIPCCPISPRVPPWRSRMRRCSRNGWPTRAIIPLPPCAAMSGSGAPAPRAPNAPPAATGWSISWAERGRFCVPSRSPPSAASGCSRATIGSMAGRPAEAKIALACRYLRPPSPEACRSPPGPADPNRLGPPGRAPAAALADAKRDATLLTLKLQEDCGIDIVTDGEQSRQHFVHGFLEFVDGIDFARKVEIGIRADRYKAMVPTVTGALRLKARVHAREAQLARAHTKRKLKFTLPGPMTIVDTVADAHYGARTKMAMAFADLLNAEARALEADGVDVIQFDEPAFNVYLPEVEEWGVDALHRAIEGLTCTTAVHICYG